MRAIEFRAWNKKIKAMYGVTSVSWCDGKIFEFGLSEGKQAWGERCVDDYILIQFTGLLDKNGKKIFDGDIVRILYEDDLSEVEKNAVVEWDQKGFWQIDFFDMGFSTAIFSDKVEIRDIIGNIYEHPGLLNP